MGGQQHAPVALIRKRDLVPIVQEAGWYPGGSGEARKISSPPGFDQRTDQPVASRYTYCASPAHYVFHDPPQKRNSLYISPLFHSKRLPCLSQYPVYFFFPLKWIRQFVANAATLPPTAIPPCSMKLCYRTVIEREDAECGGQSVNPPK
jgi:hypothetical protein